jgi:plastocyanin
MRNLAGRGKWRFAALSIAVAALVAGGSTAALGSAPITSNPTFNTFGAQSYTIDSGEVAVFQNTGAVAHNVFDYQKGGLFFHTPESVAPGASAAVDGTQYLDPGSYQFLCTIHGSSMAATLVVSSNGAPKDRPRVTVQILSNSIDKVRKSGRLKVKLRAVTDSNGAGAFALKGNKTLTKTATVKQFAAGQTKTVSLQLTHGGKKALAALKKAKVRAGAGAEFGNYSYATKTLH